MNTISLRRNAEFLRANKNDRADIARLELITVNHINNCFSNHFWAVGHVHLKNLGTVKEALDMLREAENGCTLRCFVGADAFKYAHAVVQTMG